MSLELIVRNNGICHYQQTYAAMIHFTDSRYSGQADEIWFLQHPAVYTLGLNQQRRHIIDIGDIPIVETDRGGQVTYHGLGQLIIYVLIDIKRKSMGIKDFIYRLEQAVIDMLADDHIVAERKQKAPGVYVDGKKISAIGLRIKKGYSYHGISINVNMDMSPYKGINPCGYAELEMTQIKYYGINRDVLETSNVLLPHLLKQLNYSPRHISVVDN